MQEHWQPTSGYRLTHSLSLLISVVSFVFLLCFFGWLWWYEAQSKGENSPLFSFFLFLPLLFISDPVRALFQLYYLVLHGGAFRSMAFDGETWTIEGPRGQTTVLRKEDCKRLYPQTGRLLMRDGRRVDLCVSEEHFYTLAWTDERRVWMVSWWPRLTRALDRFGRKEHYRQGSYFVGSMIAVVAGYYLLPFEDLFAMPLTAFVIAYAVCGLYYLIAWLIRRSDWYQRPIDLDEMHLPEHPGESVPV